MSTKQRYGRKIETQHASMQIEAAQRREITDQILQIHINVRIRERERETDLESVNREEKTGSVGPRWRKRNEHRAIPLLIQVIGGRDW